ncbi:MAG: nitronate monooxygenase [Bacillota bacterium]|nr:nitronate monooxygenase [Bacillota bacterium]
MRLPQLRLGNLRPRWPIIQGGMAIRISTGRLAGAVAEAGGIGVIAGTGMSEDELGAEIRIARAIAPRGVIGVNVMFAVRRFAELVQRAIDEGIDVVISGAGFSRDMFAWGRAAKVPIVPIVCSAKLARVSQDLGAAGVVVEGKEAGGHLGTDRSMQALVPEVREAVDIPVIAAGGIVEAADVVRAFEMGADGVQMGIRFAASKESNAADSLKQVYLRATDEDILLIQSPVGLPGRAIRNKFTEDLAAGRVEPSKECSACLKKCSRAFCIREALCRAQQGDVETGLIFSGQYVGRVHEILPAKEIIDRLVRQVLELRAAALTKRTPIPSTAPAGGSTSRS